MGKISVRERAEEVGALSIVARTSSEYVVEILVFATRTTRRGSKIFSEEAEGEAVVTAANPTESGGAIVLKIVVECGAGNREAERVEVRKGKERVCQDALSGSLLGEEVGPFVPRNPNMTGNPYETDGSVE